MLELNEIYPKWIACKDHFQVEIRPLRLDQIHKQVTMLRSLDDRDLAKLPCDVRDVGYAETIRQQIMDESVFRLVAWHGIDEIVGALALYRGTSRWVQHTGKVVVVTHPVYRRYGVATVLFDEMLQLAEALEIKKLYTELSDFHREGKTLAKSIGLKKEATLNDHVIDKEGNFHKLHIYSVKIEEAKRASEERLEKYVRLEHRV